jgi:hypothetical protein
METIQYINTWSVALWSVTLFGAHFPTCISIRASLCANPITWFPAYTVTDFDNYVKTNIDNSNGIMSLKCPRCSTRITTSSRYRNELRLINYDIENVFMEETHL